VVAFFAGLTTDSSQLASGLKKGFYDAGGPEAFRSIIQNTFKALFKAVVEIFKAAPLEVSIIGAAALLIPAFVASFSIVMATWMEALFDGALGEIGSKLGALKGKAAPKMAGGALALGGLGAGIKSRTKTTKPSSVAMRPVGPKPPKGFEHIALPGVAPALYGVTKPEKAPSIPKPAATLKKTPFGALSKLKGKGIGLMASAMVTLSANTPELAKAAKAVSSFAKKIPGIGVAFAGLDFAIAKMLGESTAEAAGGAAGGLAGGIIGGAIGTAIAPGIGTTIGSVLGTLIGDWVGTNLVPFFSSLPSKLSSAWGTVEIWFQNLPYNLGNAVGRFTVAAERAFVNLFNWFSQISTQFANWVNKTVVDLKLKWNNFLRQAGDDFKSGELWGKLGNAIVTGFKSMLNFAVNAISMLNPVNLIRRGWQLGQQIAPDFMKGFRAGQVQERSSNPPPKLADGTVMSEVFARANGGLGDAVRSELKNKPPGSDLVIANSSETVIPAAGGHGMLDFVETLRSGFNAMISTYRNTQTKQETVLKAINTTLVINQQQTNTRLQQLETKFSTPGMTGGLGGGAAGGVDAFTGMAQRFGLQMTSGYRPGDPGWHGVNRARDFSNGTGPTPQMMQFAQYLASNYGQNLKELIYTPLGFSIKNGQRVPPYAQGSHYNHVHVAYALGYDDGRMFTSLDAAQSWENSMVPGSVKVASVTGNSAESFGGTTINGGINVTVNGGGVNDPDELASIVALKIGEAVNDARSASIFV
jgi:hypothetical protein